MRDRLHPLCLGLLAGLLRLYHLNWDLPLVQEEALPMKKAFLMWGWETGRLQLDPQTAGWPALSFYLHLAWQQLHFWCGRILGFFTDRNDFFVHHLLDPSPVTWLARLLGVLAVAGTVYVTFRLAEKLAGRSAAWIAAGLLALCPLLTRYAQLITPDILLTLFATLALARLVAVEAEGRPRDYVLAGVWIGLGAACKYTPILLLPTVWLAHWLRIRRHGGNWFLDRRPWLATIIAGAVFLATNPYFLSDLASLRGDISYQLSHLERGHFGHEGRTIGYLHYPWAVLAPGLGITGFLCGCLGLVLATWKRRGSWLVIVLCLAPFYLILGGARTTFDRYMLPALVPLALGVAGLLPLLQARFQPANSRFGRWLPWALAVVVLAPAASGTWLYHRDLGRTSSQLLAKDFLESELAGRPIYLAMELYTVELPADNFALDFPRGALYPRLSADQQQALLDRDFHPYIFLPLFMTYPERSAFYYDLRLYRPYELFVTSSAVRGRYLTDPERFRRQLAFYDDLDSYGDIIRVFSPSDTVRGPELVIYNLTETAWERYLNEQPPLAENFTADFEAELSRDQFLPFLEDIARHAYDQGYFAQAELFYDRLCRELAPEQVDQLAFKRGLLAIESENWSVASALFQRWLELHPGDPACLVNLGFVAQVQGDLDAARTYYERAIRNDPEGGAAAWAQEKLDEIAGESGTVGD
ncbi:MAG: glycosyltransferase family 39 protein [bacterium]